MKRRHLITEYKHVLCIKAEDYCFSMYEGFVDLVGSRFDLCTTRNNDCRELGHFRTKRISAFSSMEQTHNHQEENNDLNKEKKISA